MYVLTLLVTYCAICSVCSEGLCDRIKVKYTIGKEMTILDIQAEEISQTHASCYKEVIIPGAKRMHLHVNEADFGFNKAYEYNGLTGTGYKPVYDKMELHFGNCSTFTPDLKISGGQTSEFSLDVLCLHIQPEVKYRALGAHSPGGRIQIDIQVDIAICSMTMRYEHRTCQPLCSKYGRLNNCHKGSSTSSNITAVQTSSTQTTSTRSVFNFTTSNYIKPTVTRTAYISSTISIPRTSDGSPSVEVTTATKSISISTVQTIVTQTKAISPKAITSIGAMTTFIPEMSSTGEIQTEKSYVTLKLSTTPGGTTQLNSDNLNVDNKRANFGLLEGLYVIVGCIVILLLLGIVAFFVRQRRKHDSSSGSNSGTVFPAGFQWRDNWLVRYHNNEIEGDSLSQPESEIHYLHTSYNQSNTDSQIFKHSEYPEIRKCKLDDDPYDDPWPFVRLDSEFVRNTKRVEGRKENIKIIRNLDKEQESSETASDYDENLNEIMATENDSFNNVKEKVEMFNEDKKRHKNRKHFGSSFSSKGKYNVQKVERSNSKKGVVKSHMINEMKSYLNRVEKERKKSDSYSCKSENHVKRRSSKKRSSSTRSDDAKTFEEMMRGEIKTIEDAMDNTGSTKTESYRSESMQGSDKRRNWKVNTLYAVVSSRNRYPSPDVLVARKSLQNPQVDGISLTESENGNSYTKAVSKKGSNSSHKSNNINKPAGIPKYNSEDTQPLTNNDRINNTYTKMVDYNNDFQVDIPVFENSKEYDKFPHGHVINKQPDIGNTHMSRNLFLENRQKFEDNGSMWPNKSGATGTGQFPK